LGALIRGY
jgi:hypothetical protein